MDGVAVINSLGTVRQSIRRNWKKVSLVSPYVWLSSNIPSLVLLTTAILVQLRSAGPEGEIQCLQTSSEFTQQFVHTECLRKSYSVTNLFEQNQLPVPGRPGVGPVTSGAKIRNRGHLWFVQPALYVCGLLYLLPILLWKFVMQKRRIQEVVDIVESTQPIRAEDSNFMEQRRQTDLSLTLEVHLSQRVAFCAKWLICEMLTPFITCIAWIVLESVIGMEIRLYGFDACFSPHRYHAKMTIQEYVFPLDVACKFSKSGPSGTFVLIDTICQLPCNSLYQLSFIAIWYVLVGQILFSCSTVVCFLATRCCSCWRVRRLRSFAPLAMWSMVEDVVANTDFCGYIYIYLIMSNLTVASNAKVLPVIAQTVCKGESISLDGINEETVSSDKSNAAVGASSMGLLAWTKLIILVVLLLACIAFGLLLLGFVIVALFNEARLLFAAK